MEFGDGTLNIGPFLAVTVGLIVLFVGKRINSVVGFLREYSIPEPVTGGLLFALFTVIIYVTSGVAISFELWPRDTLLVYFFTTIGINASFKDLVAGGKPLVILLLVTVAYMSLQNVVGISVASLFGLPTPVGLLCGTVSLIGGHGTAAAWAPKISETYGISNAMEIGMASATFGLILASLMGGPIAKFLVNRHSLEPKPATKEETAAQAKVQKPVIEYEGMVDAILALHICIIFGVVLNEIIGRLGLDLPRFVTCLFAGILITNLIPKSYPRITGTAWPTRTPAISLVADISLGTFLAMSLMSLQLWTLVSMAGPILAILMAQFLIAIVVAVAVVFRVLGQNYDAAVVSAGFGGISLGSTPTAMANMSAVTSRYGPSKMAFIIVPLVCAFFIDLINAVMIPFFLGRF